MSPCIAGRHCLQTSKHLSIVNTIMNKTTPSDRRIIFGHESVCSYCTDSVFICSGKFFSVEIFILLWPRLVMMSNGWRVVTVCENESCESCDSIEWCCVLWVWQTQRHVQLASVTLEKLNSYTTTVIMRAMLIILASSVFTVNHVSTL